MVNLIMRFARATVLLVLCNNLCWDEHDVCMC